MYFFKELSLYIVKKVMSKNSATLKDYNLISIHINHKDIIKFDFTEDYEFKRLLKELIK